MLNKKMQDALNQQIQAELSSSYLYLSMSAYCEAAAFKGFGKWLRIQANEERGHALKLLDYVLSRNGKHELKVIEAPQAEFGTMLQVFEKVLEHEQHVTALVHKLYETAHQEKDFATLTFMQWYVNEQVEEEATAQEIVDKLKMIGDKSSAALYLDKEYGKRAG